MERLLPFQAYPAEASFYGDERATKFFRNLFVRVTLHLTDGDQTQIRNRKLRQELLTFFDDLGRE